MAKTGVALQTSVPVRNNGAQAWNTVPLPTTTVRFSEPTQSLIATTLTG